MARWFIHEPNTAPIAPQSCACGSCGNGLPLLLLDALLVARDDLGCQSSALRSVSSDVAVAILVVVEDFLEVVMLDAEHHVGIHV